MSHDAIGTNEVTLALASRLNERGEHAAAREAYQKLLAADPLNFELLNGHALACFRLGAYAEAAADLSKAVALEPRAASLHANLALAHYLLGRLAPFNEGFARALELEPDRRDIRETWHDLKTRPNFAAGKGLQGVHAPERQVFMAAVVDLLRDAAPYLHILEIGSYMGASLLTWANAVERLHGGSATIVCVDSWGLGDTASQYGVTMASALASNQAYEIFLHNASLVPKSIAVSHFRDLSERALPLLRDGMFDIVYVDGCHYYREALSDISHGRRLVKAGGILCGDDLELQPSECDLENARRHAREDYIPDPGSGRYFHPGVTLAVHELFGRVSSFGGFWAMRKEGAGFADVSLAGARGVIPRHWPEPFVERVRAYFQASPLLGQLLD